jgi:hypothetical protein
MARFLNGQLENNQLSPEGFSQFASTIEGLRIEEIAYLITPHEVQSKTPINEMETQIKERLIPKFCRDEEALEAVVTAVERTGSVIPPDTIVTETGKRRTSPLMVEVMRIAKLDGHFLVSEIGSVGSR